MSTFGPKNSKQKAICSKSIQYLRINCECKQKSIFLFTGKIELGVKIPILLNRLVDRGRKIKQNKKARTQVSSLVIQTHVNPLQQTDVFLSSDRLTFSREA